MFSFRQRLVFSAMALAALALSGLAPPPFGSAPVFAQLDSVLDEPVATESGTNSQMPMKIAILCVLCLLWSLLSYRMLFPVFLNSVWPRTAFALSTGVAWFGMWAIVAGVFWNDLRLTPPDGQVTFFSEHGLRVVLLTIGVVVGVLWVLVLRTPRAAAST